jgi:hypothetical protein
MASIITANRNRAADAVTVRANSGSLRIYGGTPPADANAALSGNTLAAALTMGATAFAAAVNGQASANAITADASADNSVNPVTFFRVLESDGTTVVFQGTVGTAAAELILSSVNVVAGGNVSVSALTYTQAGGP